MSQEIVEHYKNNPDDYVNTKIYLNSQDQACAKEVSVKQQLIHTNKKDNSGFIEIIDSVGMIKSISEYSSIILKKRNGKSIVYFDDGNISTIYMYKNGMQHGPFLEYFKTGAIREKGLYQFGDLQDTLITFYENGKQRRFDVYMDDSLVHGKCFALNGADTSYFLYSVEATFPGGHIALSKYISQNIEYPQNAIVMNNQGKVYVVFVVERDGSITNVFVEKGVSLELDQEAIRLIKSMPNWVPGEMDGYKTRVRCRIPINFIIENGRREKRKKRG
jgi:TonB family protein